jgi:hypothetical protein
MVGLGTENVTRCAGCDFANPYTSPMWTSVVSDKYATESKVSGRGGYLHAFGK